MYFIGQRHFDKIETLVSYYMYYSELVKGEKLMYPVEPDVIRRMDSVYVSVKSREEISSSSSSSNSTTTSSNSMVALVDDQLRNVLNVEKPGMLFKAFHECGEQGQWLWAQSLATSECGLLPLECVRRVVSCFLILYTLKLAKYFIFRFQIRLNFSIYSSFLTV